ncbi:MAG: hypothetical protein COB69_02690 [Phycisphaera sp.]|nr:MAG: hypothetical protein COB69_02690 [Phycisphaera sp.]
MSTARTVRALIGTFTLVAGLAAGLAVGQESDRPLLSGPEVEDTRPGLVEDTFGGEMARGKARLGAMAAIPAQDLRKILQDMNKADADGAIRLSQEQNDRVRELMVEYQEERRVWMLANRDELSELYKAAGMPEPRHRGGREDRGGRGGRGGEEPRRGKPESEGRNMMEPVEATDARRMPRLRMPERANPAEGGQERPRPTAQQQAAQQRLRAFMSKGPTTGDLQRRIYAELSAEQQKHIDDEVVRMADERADEREMAKIQRRQNDRRAKNGRAGGAEEGAGGPGRAGGGRGKIDWDAVLPADGSVNLESLPERARARLESMDEAQQKRALEAMRKRSGEPRRRRGD